MWRASIIIVVLLVAFAGTALAAPNDFGLGIILGEPTGLSGKLWVTGTTAIDLAAAWSFSSEDAFHLHGDYLFHNMDLIKVEYGDMAVHYGVGGRVKFADDTVVGIRAPVGLTYLFNEAPLDFFVEIVPIFDIAPETDVDFSAALGMRYFFGSHTGN